MSRMLLYFFSQGYNTQYENIYIGWGHKATGPGHQPYLPPDVLCEFVDVPETNEISDPTTEEEAALRKLQNPEEGEHEEDEEGETEGAEDGAEDED